MNELHQLSDLKGLEIIKVKQIKSTDRDRPEFDSKYLKMFYFFIKEGILPTLKKYLAHRRDQQRFITFLFTRYDQKSYLNISVQSQTRPENFVLINKFFLCPDTNISYPDKDLELHLNRYNQFCNQGDYVEYGIDTNQYISYEVVQHDSSEYYDSGLFIYGLGGYVRMFIMHHFRKSVKLACVDYKAKVADEFRSKYGFRYSFVIPRKSFPLLKNVKHPTAIISTYHSDHAILAKEIFETNPSTNIFIEKPPTVTLEDLDKLLSLLEQGAKIEIGFNRRYINFSRYVKEKINDQPAIITCSIKEVIISSNHWYLWSNQGTRVTGNVVHWIDLANYWIGSIPVEINVLSDPEDIESSAISVRYKNGSLVNITASDRGNSMRGVQEKIEVRFDNQTIFINDFITLTHYKSNGFRKTKRNLRRKKGHVAMYRNFKQIIHGKRSSEYTVTDLINTSLVTYTASKMLREGIRTLSIDENVKRYHEGLI